MFVHLLHKGGIVVSNTVAARQHAPIRAVEEVRLSAEFFSDVPGPIPFGGLDSTDPLTFKVYEPDRLVLGKSMADHLRIGVCLWHSFAWPGSDVFGAGTFDRPWLGAADPMAGAQPEARRRVRVHVEARRPRTTASTIATSRPRARRSPRRARTSTRWSTRPRRTRSGPASGCCGARPICSAIRATPPARPRTRTPRSSPTRRPRSRSCSRRRKRLGGENYVLWGGREGYETLLNTDLAPRGATSSPGS